MKNINNKIVEKHLKKQAKLEGLKLKNWSVSTLVYNVELVDKDNNIFDGKVRWR
jgi:hypothetical protein|tara:strand:- start:325 stop:486 length:162 start_codon:yes stop_codon:yes gene_type:complete